MQHAEVAPGADLAPSRTLETRDAAAIIVGMVVGSGIFTVPSLVATWSLEPWAVLALWLVGGLISLIGAVCYAELATSYPDAGGDYFFMQRAYGENVAFVYAWARVAVITTGSTAFLAFTFGDYMSHVLPLGESSSLLYAVLSIISLTALNHTGIRESKSAQNLLTLLEVLGVVLIIVVGLFIVQPTPSAGDRSVLNNAPSLGVALVPVLYAYGGWNEGAYLSAEIKKPRGMVVAWLASLTLVTALFVLANWAYIRALSLPAMARSRAVAADLLKLAFGEIGAVVISSIIAISALTSINATLIVGARSNFALGRDAAMLRWLGGWNQRKGTPTTGLIAQCIVSLALVALGSITRQGLQAMIDYTAPVFWTFFLLVGIAVFVLRAREPGRPRPFRIPLFPLAPLLFCATCAYLLYSSVQYASTGSIASIGVVVLGLALLAQSRGHRALVLLFALLGAAIIALAFASVRGPAHTAPNSLTSTTSRTTLTTSPEPMTRAGRRLDLTPSRSIERSSY